MLNVCELCGDLYDSDGSPFGSVLCYPCSTKKCTGTMCDEYLTWGTHDNDCQLYKEKL